MRFIDRRILLLALLDEQLRVEGVHQEVPDHRKRRVIIAVVRILSAGAETGTRTTEHPLIPLLGLGEIQHVVARVEHVHQTERL
jgi:hypothetical protein